MSDQDDAAWLRKAAEHGFTPNQWPGAQWRLKAIADRLSNDAVTDAMIEAGVRALCTLERDILPPTIDRNQQSVEPRLLVTTIWTAMSRPNQATKGDTNG